LVNEVELLLLGAIAGFTIFFGLPVALLDVKEKTKSLLNAFAVGILTFLIVDVLGTAWGEVTDQVSSAKGIANGLGIGELTAMFLGLAVGLLGLVAYERRYIGASEPEGALSPFKLSIMIALGIGAHNLSEGLAIGQSYASGAIGLALVLVVGFGVHNATEGFGITAPLAGMDQRPKASFVAKVLLLGGGPTFIGTILGSLFFSQVAYVFFLSLAGGSLIYVTMVMYNTGRRKATNWVMLGGVFVGLCAGFLTDLIVTIGGA
jgi:zinc transporter, ZIP family